MTINKYLYHYEIVRNGRRMVSAVAANTFDEAEGKLREKGATEMSYLTKKLLCYFCGESYEKGYKEKTTVWNDGKAETIEVNQCALCHREFRDEDYSERCYQKANKSPNCYRGLPKQSKA